MSEQAAERLRVALDLADTGFELMRQNLRRRNPGASSEEIERLFVAWIADRPADCPGPVRRFAGE